mmetsp:Transcript_14687/g.33754  ORF Transcript_14687/g.33754 Transcript_14687/m.33754 type:complete len:203 (+) Transcript_14687:466-1074(+)
MPPWLRNSSGPIWTGGPNTCQYPRTTKAVGTELLSANPPLLWKTQIRTPSGATTTTTTTTQPSGNGGSRRTGPSRRRRKPRPPSRRWRGSFPSATAAARSTGPVEKSCRSSRQWWISRWHPKKRGPWPSPSTSRAGWTRTRQRHWWWPSTSGAGRDGPILPPGPSSPSSGPFRSSWNGIFRSACRGSSSFRSRRRRRICGRW